MKNLSEEQISAGTQRLLTDMFTQGISEGLLHISDTLMSAYALGNLTDFAKEVVEEHLETCAICQTRYAQQVGESVPASADEALDHLQEAVREAVYEKIIGETHVSKEHLRDYVAGTVNDGQKNAIELHLQDCTTCRSRVQYFRDLNERLAKVAEKHPAA